ncbi:alcohol dehydrogenase-like protein [Alternaria rosae]|uniref:alcohol dehydrogenase-like protein n=1 Tax=Alternaria rosae TaxID=1187941 RepID=UPI001E8E5E54|nr:alcohol dehydrogenase-like protein [Alternaria rosae]KAH6857427.1 alcohol dehydrogenase-like protein [Alternaria rosae]
MAGTVEAVGANVYEFKVGDRVAAYHESFEPHGTYSELSIAPSHSVFHIGEKTAFEDAAAVPLVAATAAVGLFSRLRLPPPWDVTPDAAARGPLLIYGAGGAVGAYAVQFAVKARLHPIIAIAGRSKDYVSTLIMPSEGDCVFDYRQGVDAVAAQVREAIGSKAIYHAFDCISMPGTDEFIGRLIKADEPSKCSVATVLPRAAGGVSAMKVPSSLELPPMNSIPDGVEVNWTFVGAVHKNEKEFGYVFFRYIGRGLQDGWLKPVPREIVAQGLDGVTDALRKMMNGEHSATKYVVRIADTASVGSG